MKSKFASLWNDSPCSIAFPRRTIALEKSQRFSVGGIYKQEKWDNKQSQKLQIIRPDTAVIEFRRKIEECQKLKKSTSLHLASKNNFKNLYASQWKTNKKHQQKSNRLFSDKTIQMDKEYDRNGMRSTFYTQNDGQEAIRYSFKKSKTLSSFAKKPKGSKLYISGADRIDLSKPINFNPGPGSYFLDKRDNEQVAFFKKKSGSPSLPKNYSQHFETQETQGQNDESESVVGGHSVLGSMQSLAKSSKNSMSKMTTNRKKVRRVSTAFKSKNSMGMFS